MSVRADIPVIADFVVVRSLRGRAKALAFRCLACQSRLKADLGDAGNLESCPHCRTMFRVPEYQDTRSRVKTVTPTKRRIWRSAIVVIIATAAIIAAVIYFEDRMGSANLPPGTLRILPPSPLPEKEPPSPTGGWRFQRSISPMDDSVGVILSLKADNPVYGWLGDAVRPELIFRFQEGQFDAIIRTGLRAAVEGTRDISTFTVRVDDQRAFEIALNQATNGKAFFVPECELFRFAQQVKNAERLIVRFTPHNSSPQTATFTLRGIRPALREIEELAGLALDSKRDNVRWRISRCAYLYQLYLERDLDTLTFWIENAPYDNWDSGNWSQVERVLDSARLAALGTDAQLRIFAEGEDLARQIYEYMTSTNTVVPWSVSVSSRAYLTIRFEVDD